MLWIRRAPVVATAALSACIALIGCANATPASPAATSPTVATPAVTAVAPTPAATLAPTLLPTVVPSTAASVPASAVASQQPITTPVPGSSLDPSLSDAGIAGRITIVDDTRPDRIGTDDHTGTAEILGRAADGSDCSYSFSGDEFTAVAWYDDAPNGMLHQMSVTIPSDEMPGNEGEIRNGITNGSVYADFVSESGFGTAYEGSAGDEDNGGTSSIDIALTGGTFVFTFTGTTWDSIAFSGQLMCSATSND